MQNIIHLCKVSTARTFPGGQEPLGVISVFPPQGLGLGSGLGYNNLKAM